MVKSTPFDEDRLRSLDRRLTGRAAFHVVSTMQTYPKEMQVAAMAWSFMAACRRYGVHPPTAFEVVTAMMNSKEPAPEVLAMQDYMQQETR